MTILLDDRNAWIWVVVEDVSGISEARSKAIAREYDDLEDLRESDRERLESVPDIGEQRADAVLERVRE
ncbi:helix-hairpin-helix domain-containing protein [Halopiger aswanensis]|uniref:Excinuclease ABC subunit C n=1 Tax=Halopiger aswanensis TaxID=148449 RepID=A0A3R7EC12_9EURY|nr:helix-hairpin-helix domain-containing protein [Halopiger aswanensis]RKD88552.1 excinuclease ABC subunit C [Halopiger aswanensis]